MLKRIVAIIVTLVLGTFAIPSMAVASPTHGSIRFSGSQYITSTVSSPPGTGAFTYEFWFYLDDASAPNQGLMNTRGGNTTDGFDVSVNANSGTDGTLRTSYAGRWISESAPGVILSKTWYHFAAVRSAGNVFKIYLDGTNIATTSVSNNFYSDFLLLGGNDGYPAPRWGLTGNISNFRYSKSVIYASNFTPIRTTLDLTADTKVLLQTYNDSTFLDDTAVGAGTFTNASGAGASELSPFVEPLTAAQKAAQAAEKIREDNAKRIAAARSKLIEALNRKETVTVDLLNGADAIGATLLNISAINLEIYAQYDKSKQDLTYVYTVVRKFYIIDLVKTSGRYYFKDLSEIGIVPAVDSVHRSVVMRYLRSLPSANLDSQKAIYGAAMAGIAAYDKLHLKVVAKRERHSQY